MFDLTISDVAPAESIIKTWATKAIGILAPEYCGEIRSYEYYLQIYFHDSAPVDCIDEDTTVMPQAHHIARILPRNAPRE